MIWPVPHVGDWFQFWFAGHLVATGQSPYDPAAIAYAEHAYGPIANGFAANTFNGIDPVRHLWLYPPWVNVALAPFGALPLEIGITLLHVLFVVVAIAAIVLTMRLARPASAWVTALVLAVGAAAMPFVLATRTGHYTAVVLCGVLLLADGWRRDSAWRVALGAVLVALKPHLFLVLALAALVALIARRRWRVLGVTAGALLVLVVVGEIISPIPLETFTSNVGTKATLDVATIWVLASLVAPAFAFALGLVIAAGAAALAWRAVTRADAALRPTMFIAATAALSLAVAPYAQTYDQLALLPATALAMVGAEGQPPLRRAAVLGGGVIAMVALAWVTYFASFLLGTQAWGALVPLATLVVLAVSR